MKNSTKNKSLIVALRNGKQTQKHRQTGKEMEARAVDIGYQTHKALVSSMHYNHSLKTVDQSILSVLPCIPV